MQRKDATKTSDNVKGLPIMSNMSYANIPFSNSFPRKTLSPFQSPNLQMALSALPLFGGTEDDDDTTDSSNTTITETKKTTDSSATQSGGSVTTATTTKELSPEQIAQLLQQNEELTNKNSQLQTENNGYKAKDQEAERAKMGREEALQADLEDRDATIVKLDAALKNQAIINAINSVEDIKFHDSKFAISKLDPSIAENMVVDLDNGTVTVNGIENDLKRIANEYDWAVKSRANGDDKNKNNQSSKSRRPSGTPPPPPNGANGDQARRDALIDKYPVIGRGRVKMPR